jgi:hypothetical protein
LSGIFFLKVHGIFLDFLIFTYYIQHCFICRPSDSTVLTDAGIEPRTVASGALQLEYLHWLNKCPSRFLERDIRISRELEKKSFFALLTLLGEIILQGSPGTVSF